VKAAIVWIALRAVASHVMAVDAILDLRASSTSIFAIGLPIWALFFKAFSPFVNNLVDAVRFAVLPGMPPGRVPQRTITQQTLIVAIFQAIRLVRREASRARGPTARIEKLVVVAIQFGDLIALAPPLTYSLWINFNAFIAALDALAPAPHCVAIREL